MSVTAAPDVRDVLGDLCEVVGIDYGRTHRMEIKAAGTEESPKFAITVQYRDPDERVQGLVEKTFLI